MVLVTDIIQGTGMRQTAATEVGAPALIEADLRAWVSEGATIAGAATEKGMRARTAAVPVAVIAAVDHDRARMQEVGAIMMLPTFTRTAEAAITMIAKPEVDAESVNAVEAELPPSTAAALLLLVVLQVARMKSSTSLGREGNC
jgi:hypothetical protein